MAGPQNRTVTLTLDAQTTGQDGVKALADELKRLAKEGGDAAPEFARLSAELSQIAGQKAAANSFAEISAEVTNAKAALDAARQSASGQVDALRRLQQATDTTVTAFANQEAAMRQARAEVQQANTGLLQARAAVASYVASIGGANRATREQRAELNTLRQAVLDAKDSLAQARAAVAALVPAYNAAKASAGQAADEIGKQESALKSANAEVQKAQSRYEELQADLEAVGKALQAMGVDTNNVADEQNRLTQSMSRLSQEATELKAKLSAPGDSAASTGKKIEQAFGVLGVRSARDIRGEIQRVNSAMMTLARAADVTEDEFNRAFTASKAKIKELEKELREAEGTAKSFANGFGEAFRQFGPATVVFNAVTAGINAVVDSARQVPKVVAEFQTMNRVLTVLTGSTNAAAKEFEYIKAVANRVGGDIKAVGDSYIRLAAATKDTALEGAQTKRVFEAVAGSMGMLGASAAETQNALMAVTQMVSKGVVSMEEMRQQLGERLPGAFQVVAKELGITTGDLNDLITSGTLTAEQMLPALARGLEDLYKSGSQNDTLVGQWQRFTNALKESANTLGGESGLVQNLLSGLRVAAAGVQGLAEYMILGARQIGIFAAAIRSGDFSGAMAMMREEFDAANARITKTSGLAETTQKSLGDMAKEAKAAGLDFVEMSDGSKLAVAAIEGMNDSVISFMVASAKAEKSAEGFATSARKAAEYTRSAGEASITAANALGNEADKRETATRVAEKNAVALDKLLAAERAVLEVQETRMARLVEEVAAKGAASDADLKIIRTLEEEIRQRQTVVAGIETQVNANNVLAASLDLQAQTLRDNSANAEDYRKASDALADALAAVRTEVDAGRMSQEQLNVVEIEARKAKALYVDALRDQQENIEAANRQKQAQIDIDRSAIQLAIEQQRTIYAVAKARGDEYTASQALVQIKRLEIELSALTAKAKRAEGEAALALAAANREQLRATGQLTAAKEAELKAQEAGARVKLKEAEIADELTKRLRELSDITQVSGTTADSAAGGYDRMAESMNTAAEAAGRLRREQERGTGGGWTGRAGSTGNPSVVDDPNYDHSSILDDPDVRKRVGGVDVMGELYRAGASVAEARAAEKYYGELFQREAATKLTGNLGTGANAARQTNLAMKKAVETALQYARQEMATGQAVDLGTSVNDLMARNLANINYGPRFGDLEQRKAINRAGNEAKAQPAVFNFSFGGNNKQVNVASRQDADTLVSVLKSLEQHYGVSF